MTFTFRCNTQRQVYVVGDFNNWNKTATPMHLGRDGLWHATVKLSPGKHEFRYWEEGDRWHTDFAACGVLRNSFGGFNSLVDVLPPIRLMAMPESHAFSGRSRVQ